MKSPAECASGGLLLLSEVYTCNSCRKASLRLASLHRQRVSTRSEKILPFVRSSGQKLYHSTNTFWDDLQSPDLRHGSGRPRDVAKNLRLQPLPREVSSRNRGNESSQRGDKRTQEAALRLQDIARTKRLDEHGFSEAMALLSGRSNGYVGSERRRSQDIGKLEHSAAATAALARFQNPRSQSKRSNRALLQELSTSQPGSEQVKRRQRSAVKDTEMRDSGVSSTMQMSEKGLVSHIFSSDKRPGLKGATTFEDTGLPLAPVLNSDLQNAWNHRARAAKEDEPHKDQLTEFEQRLNSNAFAHILGSEVRMCTLTGMRLPAGLLSDFQIQLQTETGSLWLVPGGALPEKCESPFLDENDNDQSPFSLKNFSDPTQQEATSRPDGKVKDPNRRSQPQQRTLKSTSYKEKFQEAEIKAEQTQDVAMPVTSNSAYAISSQAALDWLVRNRLRNTDWIPLRWWAAIKKSLKSLLIRGNLDVHVGKLLRRKLVRHLACLVGTRTDLLLTASDCPQATRQKSAAGNEVRLALKVPEEKLQSVAAVLWFGGDNRQKAGAPFSSMETNYEFLNSGSDKQQINEQSVPIYDMQEMLSFTELKWLRDVPLDMDDGGERPNIFNRKLVYIHRDSRTIRALSLLWQLRNFQDPFISHRVLLQADLSASAKLKQAKTENSSTSLSDL